MDPSSAAKPCHGDRNLSSQGTLRFGVWSDATWLALCHLFLGLLNSSPVQHPCLAGAAFLQATSKSERGRFQDVGFPAQEPEVTSDWELSTNSVYCPLIGLVWCYPI